MTSYSPRDMSAATGVAYVGTCASACRLIWREFTGRDIGIDGAIEVPGAAGGWTFVQVKTSESPFLKAKSKRLVFKFDEAHDSYWLAQSVPVVVCLVERKSDTFIGHKAYWIDYQRVPEGAKGLSEKSGGKGAAYIDLGLLPKGNSSGIFHQSASPKTSHLQLQRWLCKVIESRRQVLKDAILDMADRLLESGQAHSASKRLQQLKAIHLDPSRQVMGIKILRRMGRFDEITQAAAQMLSAGLDSHENRLMCYEFGYAFLTRAMSESSLGKPDGADIWARSCNYFKRSFSDFGSPAVSHLERLVGLSGLVSAKAMRAHFKAGPGPTSREERDLRVQLALWKRGGHADKVEHSRRIINARLALARAALSRAQIKEADRELTELRRDKAAHHYTSPRVIAHYLAVKAWKLLDERKIDEGKATLSACRIAATPIDDDPEIRAILDNLAMQLAELTKRRNH